MFRAAAASDLLRRLAALAAFAVVLTLPAAGSAAGSRERHAPPAIPRIVKIRVVRVNVFSPAERRAGLLAGTPIISRYGFGRRLIDLTGPRRWDIAGLANRIHFQTVEGAIRSHLLFKVGDRLDPWRLYETERNLRALPFIRNASVVATTDPVTGGAIVTVTVKDAWTTIPVLSFTLLGGTKTNFSLGGIENNLFGHGKSLAILHGANPYRYVNLLRYDDPILWDTHWHLQTNLASASDGQITNGLIEYPFYSLETADAANLTVSGVRDTERIFSLDQSDDGQAFNHSQFFIAAGAAHAFAGEQDLVRRVGLRLEVFNDGFRAVPGTSKSELGLRDTRTSALMLDLIEWHPRYVKETLLDQLGRPEDRDVGWQLSAHLGFAPSALGSTRNAVLAAASLRAGARPWRGAYLFYGVNGAGMGDGSWVRDTFASAEAVGYQRLHTRIDQTLVLDTRFDWSAGLLPGNFFLAGDSDGQLRGYPINSLVGTRRLLFHLEDRALVFRDLFHLFAVGPVAFLDAGELWGIGRPFTTRRLVASVGVGLRIAFTRSSFQIPLRIDFAIPLVHGHGAAPLDASIGPGQAFEPFADPFNSAGSNATLAPSALYDAPYMTTDPFNAQAYTSCWGCDNLPGY